ncbi:hypothetical protein IL397_22600 [Escherichia coli]|uniref:hypothetical protein n=1 Tax=Escherichia coli TaxID=562 RepID=UPI00193290DA|nr:hypothetical protein [Escherichia coli]MBL7424148.1 hypothetical protein [Escherichia coli]
MSTSAQNQSIENVSIPDVLNAGIPAIIQNIRAAQRRVSCDDLTARFFDLELSNQVQRFFEVNFIRCFPT